MPQTRDAHPVQGRKPKRTHHLATLGLPALGLTGALLLGGCAVGEGGMVEVMNRPTPAVDSALAALARGRVGDAEAWTARALAANPADPHALLIRGMMAEQAGQPAVAREAYETILRLEPDATIDPTPMDMDSAPRPVVEIAADRLSRLPPTPVGPGFARVPGVTGPTAMETPDPQTNTAPTARDEAWQNVSGRFETLERLFDQGLITDTEYAKRRRENLGALLPLTQEPPAAGLTRPAPRATAVVGRLRDLAGTFESGAISASQHAAERRAILDALLPAEPVTHETADMRPRNARDVARMARRLEDALRRGLITNAEYDAERAALNALARQHGQAATAAVPPPAPGGHGGMDDPAKDEGHTDDASEDSADGPRPLLPVPTQPGVTAGPPTANAEDPATQRFSGVTGARSDAAASQPDGNHVHLASYRTLQSAQAGWAALSARYAGLMRGMMPTFERVTIPDKGEFIRLKAGPVEIPGGTARLCDQLRGAGQFCEPTKVN
ncbi:SHOCT domain-containing protein [uncultured Rhodospira sp.]|uniref:SHOCT domain-containing protein n=1 Tax=uncultured Rhodospira sp. TaxID=1936189 RepID=UPI0026191E8A|nr:SHOCT domain-containing protein [uncultured Rhodospira sp.]